MTSKKPLFITLEGIEGVGKSTHLKFLSQALEKAEIPMLLSREPGGTPLAEELRALLLAERLEKVTANTEALLMFAARSQHLQNTIIPALQEGKWVLCDRFVEASFAYQGGGRGVSTVFLEALESHVVSLHAPDYVLLLDAPVSVGLSRMAKRGKADRFEKEGVAFFERVRAAYLQRAALNPERFRIIDASGSLIEVELQLTHFLNEILR
jgi:dTMP kinase